AAGSAAGAGDGSTTALTVVLSTTGDGAAWCTSVADVTVDSCIGGGEFGAAGALIHGGGSGWLVDPPRSAAAAPPNNRSTSSRCRRTLSPCTCRRAVCCCKMAVCCWTRLTRSPARSAGDCSVMLPSPTTHPVVAPG